jgi:glycosyltransferase involved in cell wall biosynthesis
MSLISVIIPVYNRSGLIKESVGSVLGQSYTELEVIVVDDGSTDDTPEKVEDIIRSDKRVRLVRLDKNKGAQVARKTGVKAAMGKFIAFLDSDDIWYPEKLKKQLKRFEELGDQVAVVHGDLNIFSEATGEERLYRARKLSGDVYKELLQRPGPLLQCMMIRRSAINDEVDIIDTALVSWQEWDLSINLSKNHKFAFIDEPLMLYNIHAGDTISKDMLRDIEGYLYIVDKHREEILGECGKEALGRHFYTVAMKYLQINDYKRSKEYIEKASEMGIKSPMDILFYALVTLSPRVAVMLRQLFMVDRFSLSVRHKAD